MYRFQNNWGIKRRHISGSEEREGENREREGDEMERVINKNMTLSSLSFLPLSLHCPKCVSCLFSKSHKHSKKYRQRSE
jgi:hypothetical protein